MPAPSLPLRLDSFWSAPRWLLEARLAPVQGVRFQPAGFPDLGPAVYVDPEGVERVVVESPQSLANHLEATVWDPSRDDVIEPLAGLAYVRVLDPDGRFLTSSILEPHRIASPYVLHDGTIRARLEREMGPDLEPSRLPQALYALDVGALIHGVFLQRISGALRLPRLLGGFIEGIDAHAVATGGVKLDRIEARGAAREGYGQVVFHREEFVARDLRLFIHLDVALLRGLRLAPSEEALVLLLALHRVRRLLDAPIRLRARCDLESVGPPEIRPREAKLPSLEHLEAALHRAIRSAENRMEVTEVEHPRARA